MTYIGDSQAEAAPALSARQLHLVLVSMCLALGTVVSAVSSLNVALVAWSVSGPRL